MCWLLPWVSLWFGLTLVYVGFVAAHLMWCFTILFVVVYLDARCSGVINLVVGEFVVAFQSLIVLCIRYGICVCC